MNFCTRCGKRLEPGERFCSSCGFAVTTDKNISYQQPYIQQPAVYQDSADSSVPLGIIGIIFAWLFALVGHITSIIGIIQGSKEYQRSGKTSGLILSIIGEICSVISSSIGVITMLNL